MPGLAQSLEGQDLGRLRILADLWRIQLPVQDVRSALQQLEELLPQAVADGLAGLPVEARAAVAALSAQAGRLPWGLFTRNYGELRELGAARREKEQTHLHPISATEILWYRGLLGRTFFDTPDGLREFAYIPDELLAVLDASLPGSRPFGRVARPEERAHIQVATDQILDQTCTLLAALRLGVDQQELAAIEDWSLEPRVLKALLVAAGILDRKGLPIPEATRLFLEAPRSQSLADLAGAWLKSNEFNEMYFLPGLQTEGPWANEPLATRHKVVSFARGAAGEQWWSISALVADVKARQPDFQRPAGDFDSWYLREAVSGAYLRGFAHWEAVDGALLAYILTGPLHNLGFVDLASPAAGKLPTAFRWSRWGQALLNDRTPLGLKVERLKLKVDSQGKILIPPLAPRAVRYLVARFCEWLPRQKDGAVYALTASSLERARKQGLKVTQLLNLLKVHSAAPLPPNLAQALKRWEQQGSQACLSSTLVLRVSSTAALKALRSSRAARYLGEPLGPAAIEVKPGARRQVLQALLELGYLGELKE
ncbi:MAG: helicase-associated domain-containing protein [Anaerolineales bacterium]